MAIIVPQRYEMRGDTKDALAARNEVLYPREACCETDTGAFKFGDGVTPWNDLLYAGIGLIDFSALADGQTIIWDGALGQWKTGVFATQAYVDAALTGLSWKQHVRVATTSAQTLATAFAAGQVRDGVTLATGDRILIKNQATASENGIYTVNASGAPTRATDADSGAELVNASVYVSEGTVNADTQWVCTTNAPITLGTTSLAWAQLTSGGGSVPSGSGFRHVTSGAEDSASKLVDTADINNNQVTYAKLQDVSATARIIARKSAGAGDPEECTLSDILDFIGSAAQGDLLYRGATGWARLAAGTSGLVLTTQGASANPVWGSVPSASGGAMSLVGTATVSGSAATSLSMSGLNLALDKCYYIQWALKNNTGSSTPSLSLYYNSDTTATNYATQYAYAVNSTVNSPSFVNSAVLDAFTSGTSSSTGDVLIFNDPDGRPRSQFRFSRGSATSPQVIGGTHGWNSTANITGITVVASVANALAVGSYFKVFKVN
jgi:hypothetical protein